MCPLSQQADSSPNGRAKKDGCFLIDYFNGEPRKSTCLSLWERWRFRRNLWRGFTPSVSYADSSLREGALYCPLADSFDFSLSVSLCSIALLSRRRQNFDPSQSASLTALPEGEPRKNTLSRKYPKREPRRYFSFKNKFSVAHSIALRKIL